MPKAHNFLLFCSINGNFWTDLISSFEGKLSMIKIENYGVFYQKWWFMGGKLNNLYLKVWFAIENGETAPKARKFGVLYQKWWFLGVKLHNSYLKSLICNWIAPKAQNFLLFCSINSNFWTDFFSNFEGKMKWFVIHWFDISLYSKFEVNI